MRTTLVSTCALLLVLCLSLTARATIVVDDSWADGGRDNGADPMDTNWWTSSASAGIEVSVGSMGLVSGSQGRGIHAIFPTQTLAIGDSLVATYTFKTPATVGTPGSGAFRIGLFDTLGRAGLDANISSSSTVPNAIYGWGTGAAPPGPGTAGLPGYMLDMDVGAAGTEDFNFRQHDTGTVNPTGRLLGTTTGFASIGNGPDGVYAFAPNTTYVGSLTLTRTNATDMQVTGTLGAANFTINDPFDSTSYGMLAFWANSNTFGTASTINTADNGIDFTNVKIEYIAAPEPAGLALFAIGGTLLARRRRS